jgi:hypothetical protein
MRHILKLKNLIFFLLLTLHGAAQINPVSVINLGTGLGKNISEKIKDKKKKKTIENSLSEIELNGITIIILRVPEDKIKSEAKGYIVRIQKQLDAYYSLYKKNEHIDLPYYFDDIPSLKAFDNDWTTEYYENEFKEYRKYEQRLTQVEKHIKDSIETVKRIEQKKISDSIIIVRKKHEDSIAYSDRVYGYVFVNKEFTYLKDKPSDKSQNIGKIYLGSYLKLLGYGDNSNYVKVSLQDLEGYVNKNDLTDTIDKITIPNADISTYKSRRYYKYEPNYEYVKDEPKNFSSSMTSPNNTHNNKPSTQKKVYKQRTRYIRGPRGGCYYMSGSSKIYVDRSYCN